MSYPIQPEPIHIQPEPYRLMLWGSATGCKLVGERESDHGELVSAFIDDALVREVPSAEARRPLVRKGEGIMDGASCEGYRIFVTVDSKPGNEPTSPDELSTLMRQLESAISVALLELFSFIAVELVTTVTSPEGRRRGPDSRPLRGDRGV